MSKITTEDLILVNRAGVDYKVKFDGVVDSLPFCRPSVTKDDLTGDFEYLGEINPNDLNTYVDNWPSASTGNKLYESSSEIDNIGYEAPLYKLSGKDDPNQTWEKFKAVGNYVTYIDANGNEQQGQIEEWYEFEDYDDGREYFVVIEVQGIPEEDITLTNKTKLANACVPGLAQVVASGDTEYRGIHCDGDQSTFMGAGIKTALLTCKGVSYYDDRMYAKRGINVGNHIYFADEYDEWYLPSDQGRISNACRLDFGDYKDQGRATDIAGVENIFFKSGDEYSTDYGGMISGCNTLYFSRNEETENPTQISGLTKLYFTANDGATDAYEAKAELTGLSRLSVNENFESNIVSQLPELPD